MVSSALFVNKMVCGICHFLGQYFGGVPHMQRRLVVQKL